MPIYYLDTSALLKYYIQEPGTDFMVELLESNAARDQFLTSTFTLLELSSAIFRRFHVQTARDIQLRFDEDTGVRFNFWPLDMVVLSYAVASVRDFRLRTGDMVHLSSALTIVAINNNIGDSFMVSSDKELLNAAASTDLIALDPQAPDSLDLINQLRSSGQ
ncbi:MAG: type II toxin-antitoxin system VapC family toxin [Chloroflexi bacterium]|nr:type II toxin-antitoxin system VapC family toxin [Chloroflexota bacterium]